MPDANSAFEIAPGRTTDAASKNANQIPSPINIAANEGKTNNPEPNIADSEMIITPTRPTVRSI